MIVNDSKNYVCGLHQKKNSSFNFVPVKKMVAMANSRLRKYKAFLNPNSAWITRWAPSFIFNIFIIIYVNKLLSYHNVYTNIFYRFSPGTFNCISIFLLFNILIFVILFLIHYIIYLYFHQDCKSTCTMRQIS